MAAKVYQMPKRRPQKPAVVAPLDDEILTLEEAAQLLKVSKRTLYYHVERSSVPFFKAGRLIRFSRNALFAWLEQTGQGSEDSVA